jgi:hypothetical protein
MSTGNETPEVIWLDFPSEAAFRDLVTLCLPLHPSYDAMKLQRFADRWVSRPPGTLYAPPGRFAVSLDDALSQLTRERSIRQDAMTP